MNIYIHTNTRCMVCISVWIRLWHYRVETFTALAPSKGWWQSDVTYNWKVASRRRMSCWFHVIVNPVKVAATYLNSFSIICIRRYEYRYCCFYTYMYLSRLVKSYLEHLHTYIRTYMCLYFSSVSHAVRW